MAFDPGAIDATLAAAVGEDPALIAELRLAFVESAERAVEALDIADDAERWRAACWRLRGLAASFGAERLMALATEAASAVPGDDAMRRRVRRAATRL